MSAVYNVTEAANLLERMSVEMAKRCAESQKTLDRWLYATAAAELVIATEAIRADIQANIEAREDI